MLNQTGVDKIYIHWHCHPILTAFPDSFTPVVCERSTWLFSVKTTGYRTVGLIQRKSIWPSSSGPSPTLSTYLHVTVGILCLLNVNETLPERSNLLAIGQRVVPQDFQCNSIKVQLSHATSNDKDSSRIQKEIISWEGCGAFLCEVCRFFPCLWGFQFFCNYFSEYYR